MYIWNKFGVMHTIPEGAPLPPGAREAKKSEIEEWEAQDAENKEAILRKKQADALARAQTVVVSAPAAPAETEAKTDDLPKGGGKKEPDAK